MAKRRMFSCDVTESDAFSELPTSAQALYFHIGISADDDGFVNNAKMLLKIYGCMMDDLDELVKAGFLIRFESGIYLVRHWLVNNQIQRDRYHETIFLAEKAMVRVDKSRVYNLETSCIHSVSNPETESSLSSQDELEKRNIYNGATTAALPPFYNGRSAPESEVREKEAEWNRMRNERMREVSNLKH